VGSAEEERLGMRRRLSAPLFALAILFCGTPGQLSSQETHLLVVVGLGGDAGYRELFHGWAVDMTSAAVTRLGLADDRVVYLGERPEEAPGIVDDRSTLENLASTIARMAGEAGPRDRILLVFIGHGTGQGEEARFNLPGPDLTPEDLQVMLGDFPTQTVAVVITSPSSGPFIPALSGPNRVVLTATRSALERNETQFGGFFVEALSEDGSDLDKDGRTSLAEAFEYARREVKRYYESRNLLATEHPQLDDDGDGEGSTELGGDVSDGRLASAFWLESPPSLAVPGLTLDSIADPELLRLYGEKAELERRVLELRALRGQMEESRYEQELEALLVELALKNREIREKGGEGL
jgi:hypothetical protein